MHDCASVALGIEDLPGGAVAFTPEAQTQPAAADLQVAQFDVRQPVGQRRINIQRAIRGVRAQAKHSGNQLEDAPRHPCLRDVGAGILHRETPRHARQPGEKFGELVVAEARGGLEDRMRDEICLGGEAVALESGGDDRVVVRPDRAELVRK